MDMTRIEKVIEGMRKMNLEQFLVTDPELMDRVHAIGYEGQICSMEKLREHEIEEKKLTAIREQMIDTDICLYHTRRK